MNRVAALIALLLIAACATTPQDADLVVIAPRLLDVARGEILSDRAVIVRNGTIASIEAANRVARIRGPRLQLPANSTLIPGLIDTHVHLAWDGTPSDDAARLTLMAGFTTVRNPGATGTADVTMRDAIEGGRMQGPRVVIARTGIGAPGGVCERTFGAKGVSSPEEGRARVAQLIGEGAQLIKICTGGDVYGRPADIEKTEMSAETVAAIVDEAHRRNVRVAAHAQGPQAIRLAANAGVDSIEHGALIDADTATLLAQKHIVLVPTLARLATLPKLRADTFARIRVARERGVRLVFGTDGGVLPYGENAKEFAAMVEVGMSPLDAIRSATVDAAKLIGWQDRVGEIAPGRFADLVAVCGNPLTSASIDVAVVVARGRVVRDDGATLCHPERSEGPGRAGVN